MDGANVFIVFGAFQILMGLVYGLPMPLQPLKAMAVLVITQKISGSITTPLARARADRSSSTGLSI
ncbi:MAG: hypothetical protein EHM45_24335 [Desulfobacteraceae bacterium]|nr:MAG: hypothetical protein EHM45_24335 [Desulfobacteraceae bacterium]